MANHWAEVRSIDHLLADPWFRQLQSLQKLYIHSSLAISLHPATVPQGFQLSKFINLCYGSHHFTSPLQMVSKSAGISTFQGWSTHGLHQSGDGRVGVRFFTQHRTHQGGPHDHGGYISNTEREGESYIYIYVCVCDLKSVDISYLFPESYIYKWYVYEYYIYRYACMYCIILSKECCQIWSIPENVLW